MAASVSTASAPPSGGKGGGRKILGMPAPVVIAGGIALVLGVGWVLLSRRRATAQAAQATGATTKVGGGIDWSGPVSTLQAEVIDLQGEVAQINREETTDEKTDKQLKADLAEQGQDEKQDQQEDRRENKKHRCPNGFHFMPVPANSDLWPEGGRRVPGGFCVPDRHHKHHHHRQPAAA